MESTTKTLISTLLAINGDSAASHRIGQPRIKNDRGRVVSRDRFVKLVADVLDSLPSEFRSRIHNLAVLVEDQPKRPSRPHRPRPSHMPGARRLVLGVFEGVPSTQKSVFDLPRGPNRIVLYQKNIEAICSSEAEIRREVRQTVLHELGHYFGMSEAQLKDV